MSDQWQHLMRCIGEAREDSYVMLMGDLNAHTGEEDEGTIHEVGDIPGEEDRIIFNRDHDNINREDEDEVTKLMKRLPPRISQCKHKINEAGEQLAFT